MNVRHLVPGRLYIGGPRAEMLWQALCPSFQVPAKGGVASPVNPGNTLALRSTPPFLSVFRVFFPSMVLLLLRSGSSLRHVVHSAASARDSETPERPPVRSGHLQPNSTWMTRSHSSRQHLVEILGWCTKSLWFSFPVQICTRNALRSTLMHFLQNRYCRLPVKFPPGTEERP